MLVHCQAGISRSCSAVLMYLMQVDKIPLNRAYQKVKGLKPNVGPNLGSVVIARSDFYQCRLFQAAFFFRRKAIWSCKHGCTNILPRTSKYCVNHYFLPSRWWKRECFNSIVLENVLVKEQILIVLLYQPAQPQLHTLNAK